VGGRYVAGGLGCCCGGGGLVGGALAGALFGVCNLGG